MELSQAKLPSQLSNDTYNVMSETFEHNQLCQWLKAVASTRNKVAFTRLFKYFAPRIFHLARKKFINEAQAKEVVQETMSNVWRKAHLFDENKGAACTWVYTIMRNVSFDMLRKLKTRKEDNLGDEIWPIVQAENNDSYDDFDDHLEKNNIQGVIENLPQSQRQVIKGFYFNEMSQEQLAEHLNVPLGTIKSRLRLALAKLKSQLGEDHD